MSSDKVEAGVLQARDSYLLDVVVHLPTTFRSVLVRSRLLSSFVCNSLLLSTEQ